MYAVVPAAFAQRHIESITGLAGPTGLALDTVGGVTYLYVAELDGGKVSSFNVSGATATVVGGATGFSQPNGILIDPTSHDLLITDRLAHQVIRMTNTGSSRTNIAPAGQLSGPVGIARDSTGAIYVTEHDTFRVQKFTVSSTGALVPVTTGWPLATGSQTYAVAVDSSNNVYIGDRGGTIRKYSSAGAALTAGNIPVGRIVTGISVGPGGALYTTQATDAGSGNRVQRFPAAATTADLTWGSDGTAAGQFNLAFNIVVNPATNRAYVSDYVNDSVQVFDLSLPPGGGDTTAPTATITANSSTATANSVTFTVAFNESVTGGSASSFTAAGAGATIASVTPSATTATTSYTVTVNFTGTTGTVTLNTSAAATTSIKDASNNFYAGGAAQGAYTIPGAPPPPPAGDTTAPVINSFELTSVNGTASTAVMTVTFNEAVTGVDVSDFAFSTTGTATVSNVSVSGSGAAYNVNFTFGGTNGSLQFGIRTSGTGITDAAGNAFAGAGVAASAPAGANPIGEMVLPTVTGIVAGTPASSAVNFTVTFSEAVTGFDRTDVLVSVPSTATATVGTVTGSGTTWTVPVSYTGSGQIRLTIVGGVTSNIRDTATHWYAGGMAAASATFTIPSSGGTAPTIAAQTVNGTVGTAVNYQVVATGATSFSTTSTMPAGLSLSAAGVISGTPTAATPTGGTVVTVTATNASGSNSAPVTINIAAAPPTGTAPTIAAQTVNGTVGTAVNYQVVATGATSFSTTSAMPAGLSLSAAGVISGTPTAATPTAGTVVTVTATNASGSSSAPVTIKIVAAPPAGSAPTIAAQTVNGTVGTVVNYQVVATGATSFSTTSLMPAGLSLSAAGIISGNPSAATPTAGTVVTVTATNANGSSSAPVTIKIVAAGTPADTTPPAPTSFVKTSQNATTVTFTLTFSEAVTGVDSTDFTINASSGVTASVAPSGVTGSGTTYTIVASYTGTGTLGLTLKGSGTGIVDAAGNANASSAVSSTASVTGSTGGTPPPVTPPPPGADTTAPTPNSFVLTSSNGSSATFTLTFNEPVTGVDATDFSITKSGTINPAITTVTGSGTTYTIVATYTGSGTFALTLKGTANGITDAAGNAMVSSAFSSTFSNVAAAVPPPSGGSIYFPPPAYNPPPVVKSNQTVTFVSPVSALLVNQEIALSATSSSGLPVTFTIVTGNATLSGDTITLHDTQPVVVRASQGGSATINPASTEITLTAQRTAQLLNVPSMSNKLTTDGSIQLSATSSSGLPITYSLVSGPAILNGNTLTLTGRPGEIVVNVSQPGNDAFFPATSQMKISIDPAARLVNLSSRMNVTNDQPVIVGFVVSGTTEKQVLVRAVGPGLGAFGVTGAVSNPRMQLFDGNGRMVAENDDWSGTDVSTVGDRVGAFRLMANSRDAAVVARLAPGAYTAVVSGVNSSGVVLIEVYDAATREQIATQQLVNISTRGFVGNDQDSLIAGFVVTGSAPKRVLVRGIGPSLTQFGVTGAVSNPVLRIVAAGSDAALAQNDNWGTPVTVDSRFAAASAADISAAGLATGAFPLAAGSNDAAIVISLAPGNYSAVMSGTNNATGAGLIEVYELPNQ